MTHLPWAYSDPIDGQGMDDEDRGMTMQAITVDDDFPTIVCLCGSTRFSDAFREANLNETLAGRIVLTIGCDMKSDAELFSNLSAADLARMKADLDALHLRKIELADEVLILNCDDYVGESTRRELEYARKLGKPIRFLEAHDA